MNVRTKLKRRWVLSRSSHTFINKDVLCLTFQAFCFPLSSCSSVVLLGLSWWLCSTRILWAVPPIKHLLVSTGRLSLLFRYLLSHQKYKSVSCTKYKKFSRFMWCCHVHVLSQILDYIAWSNTVYRWIRQLCYFIKVLGYNEGYRASYIIPWR